MRTGRSSLTTTYEAVRLVSQAAGLADAIARYHLPRGELEAVIDGMAMDAEEDIVAPSEAKLDLYCDRVASAVGRLSVRIFGVCPAGRQDVRAASLRQGIGITPTRTSTTSRSACCGSACTAGPSWSPKSQCTRDPLLSRGRGPVSMTARRRRSQSVRAFDRRP